METKERKEKRKSVGETRIIINGSIIKLTFFSHHLSLDPFAVYRPPFQITSRAEEKIFIK